VEALDQLAALEVFAGSPDADRLSTEALILGQALDVGASQLSGLLQTRAIHLYFAGRRTEAVAYLREAAQLAAQAMASGELAGHERIAFYRAELAALRGDAAAAETVLGGLGDMRAAAGPRRRHRACETPDTGLTGDATRPGTIRSCGRACLSGRSWERDREGRRAGATVTRSVTATSDS
jgi:hypothetical protein